MKNVENEDKLNLLENLIQLYLRVIEFLLARDIVGKHKLASKRKHAKALRKDIKKSIEKPNISC